METNPESEIVIRSLSVKLTDKELRERSIELAQVLDDVGAAEHEKKAATARFNEAIETLNSRSRTLGSAVKSGTEVRQVECRWIQNMAEIKMELRRDDTGEVVESRPMTKEERQVAMFPSPFAADKADRIRRRAGKSDDQASGE